MVVRRRKFSVSRSFTSFQKFTLVGIVIVFIVFSIFLNFYQNQLQKQTLAYQQKQEDLSRQLNEQKKRAEEIQQKKLYIQSKQYIEDQAKEKLGLVKPGEFLLKPKE
ncbi:hypothetical protein FACS189418_7400 [Clostridia bacterium]|nr:hypothetical protein FACS189418_7400 [Clostridia bacterium]